MLTPFSLPDFHAIDTPALVVDRGRLIRNLRSMIEIAGSTDRLRPHCKTHKMEAVTRLELDLGITKHKAATIAEVEMLAQCGVRDIVLSYPVIGPKVARVLELRQRFPDMQLRLTVDSFAAVNELSTATKAIETPIEVLIDLNTGQHRTGVTPDEVALRLYDAAMDAPGIRPVGLHLYDGQNHQTPIDERRSAVLDGWKRIESLQSELQNRGLPVQVITVGATGSFPIFATVENPALELCPGTCVLHDAGYGTIFPDLPFDVAAMMVTRVISRPTSDRMTLDLGYKAVSADPPAGRRVVVPDIPDAAQVLQNEEHLVLQTSEADRYQPGDVLAAIPWHICPTVALHQEAWVVEDGQLIDRWPVTARDRRLTI